MKSFLRKIRQDMLKQNRFTRYLIYALGEVILVVVGILIALQINTSKELRRDRATEINYLNNLKIDLKENLVDLEMIRAERERKVSSALDLLKIEELNNYENLMRHDSLIGNVFPWKSYQPRTNTLEDLLHSGNFKLIQNDSIKNLMLDIRQLNEEIVESRNHMRREYDHYLYDKSTEVRIVYEFTDFQASFEQGKWVKLPKPSDAVIELSCAQSMILLNDVIFRNGLRLAAGNNHHMVSSYRQMELDIHKLLDFIEKDLSLDDR